MHVHAVVGPLRQKLGQRLGIFQLLVHEDLRRRFLRGVVLHDERHQRFGRFCECRFWEVTRGTEVAPASQLALIESVAIFAPLSLVAKERIASHLLQVDVAPGEVVIRTGEAGDRFYIVGDGELTIEVGSRRVSAGPGDFFGEIALLRDVPRTATVRADTAARLYALERDDFLAIVTGNSLAHTEADAVAAERLARG